MKSILGRFFGLFTSTTAKQGVTFMKDGKALTEQEIAAMGETADAHEALNDTFAAAVDLQGKTIADLETRVKASEAAAQTAASLAQTVAKLQEELASLKNEQKTSAEKLEASQKQVTTLAQEFNKGKTTPFISVPNTPDGANPLVEQKDLDTAMEAAGHQDENLKKEMLFLMQKAQASAKKYPTT